jgi:outer membrane protein
MRLSSLIACSATLLLAATGSLTAQSATPAQILTVSDALVIARQNNPAYRTAQNARRIADANVRTATGAFLPNVNTNFSGDYREGRQQFFGGQGFGSTNDQLNTNGSIAANVSFSMTAVNQLRAQRASAEAVEADITAAEQNLRQQVTTQFVVARQAKARAALQDTLLITTRAQLDLARARLTVGSGTQLDVQRAEVANGQQRVAALTAHNQADIELLRLFQVMGVPAVAGTELVGPLDVTLPAQSVAELLEQAERANPVLDAARQRERQAARSVSAARSAYLPSLTLSTNVSGFTQRFTDIDAFITQQQGALLSGRTSCIRAEEVRAALGLSNTLAQCQAIAWSPLAEQAIRDDQGRYPLDFTRNPYGVSATVSLPIFNGFRRESDLQGATVQRRNAENAVRQEALRVTTEVTAAYLTLTASKQTVDLQDENAQTARTALQLAEERYKAGAINLVELIQSRTDFERAATDRINAIYEFQRAFAVLEGAVGRPLR